MAIRQILHHPDPRLRTVAAAVTRFDDELGVLVDDMLDTMYAAPGIGLAATQINIHQRVVVIDVSSEKQQPLHLINPIIVSRDGEEEMEEGCLSVPDVFETVCRAERVTVSAQNRTGSEFEFDADGLLAVCIQHEIDHLDGKLFVDYLSQLKQSRIKKRLEKEQRLAG